MQWLTTPQDCMFSKKYTIILSLLFWQCILSTEQIMMSTIILVCFHKHAHSLQWGNMPWIFQTELDLHNGCYLLLIVCIVSASEDSYSVLMFSLSCHFISTEDRIEGTKTLLCHAYLCKHTPNKYNIHTWWLTLLLVWLPFYWKHIQDGH